MSTTMRSQRAVLVSYSHDSPAHSRLVLDLAQQLRAHGIPASIDQFLNGDPEEGWPRWMERNIRESDFVLVVCTATYERRYNGDEVDGRGLGATWESILTRQALYEAQGRNKKFIPVVFRPEDRSSVPAPLRQYTVYHLMDEYTPLLRVLLDQPEVIPAPLGAPLRLAGSVQTPAAVIAGLPLPLAQTLLRSVNSKTHSDAWLGAHHFFEATLRMMTASQIALYAAQGPQSDAVNSKLKPTNWTGLQHWLDVLCDLVELSACSESFTSRIAKRQRWQAAGDLMVFLGQMSADSAEEFAVMDVFRAIIANRPAGDRDVSADRQGLECARLIRDAILEVLHVLQPFGSSRLAFGTYGAVDTGGAYAYQYISLHGDGLRLPLAAKVAARAGGGRREGELWWIGEGEPLSLHPFLVLESRPGGVERVGFLNSAARRLFYLDFQSGEYLQTHDADQGVAQFLEKIWGRSVSPSEVRSLAAEQSPAIHAAPLGRRWIADFEIIGELGRGAMGIVYRARQASLGRMVALKVLPAAAAASPLTARRFQLEVEALGRCDHPNVIKVLTRGSDGDSQYYAMELVDGSDLARMYSVLKGWRHSSPGPLTEGHLIGAATVGGRPDAGLVVADAANTAPIDDDEFNRLSTRGDYYRRLAEIVAEAARGVQHLHDHHLLHRDIKPSNLMLSRDGRRTIVMDLGLAKATDAESLPGSSQVAVLGTLRYMAPEQLQRKLITLTPQGDIYALGATLYELACLAPIFDGDNESRLTAQVLFEEPISPRKSNPGIPVALALIIEKATAKIPAKRYLTAAAMAEDLDSFVRDGFTLHAKPPSVLQLAGKFVKSHRTMAALAAIGVAALAAGYFLWDYNRIKTYEYANSNDVRQVPVGIGPLSAKWVAGMQYHTELQYQRGKLVLRRIVNSAGSLERDIDESEWRYHYRQDGSLERTEAFNANHVETRVIVTSADGKIVEFKDKGGGTLNKKSESGRSLSGASEITRNFVEYDASGLPMTALFQNSYGRPKADDNGSFGKQYEHDAAGFVTRSWDLDAHGRKKLSANGVFETRMEVDTWGYLTKKCYLTPTGEPAVGASGFSCGVAERDAMKNIVKIWNLGPNGNRVMPNGDCAGERRKYDSRGFMTENACLDTNGNLTTDKNGVAILRIGVDDNGNAIQYSAFGPDGNPTYNQQGISIHKIKVDATGSPIDESYFGVNGQPVTDEHGHHRVVRAYTNGRETRIEQFGTDGRRVYTQQWMPIETYAYDQDGNQTEERVFDERGAPAVDSSGKHRVQNNFDERGNLIEEIFFDTAGNRVVARGYGFASVTGEYDSGGNLIAQAAFGPDGKPIMLSGGFHRKELKYDDAGLQVQEAYFDAQGHPAQLPYHKGVVKRDPQGNITELSYFAADGQPSATSQGVHRLTRAYDGRGNLIEEASFGKNGAPVPGYNGIHMRRWKFDEWGRRIEESYWGEHGEAVLHDGYHQEHAAYDSRGHIVEQAYFDEQARPCLNKNGIHRDVSRYDERGYLVEESYFSADGKPGMFRGEYHRGVMVLDDHGNQIENRTYDGDGHLVLTGGRAIFRAQFDARGNEVNIAYYGIHDEPVRRLDKFVDPTWAAKIKRRNGVARAAYTYDTSNRVLREDYYGPDNQRTENTFGAAWVVFDYGSGKPVEKWFRATGAEMAAKNLEPPRDD